MFTKTETAVEMFGQADCNFAVHIVPVIVKKDNIAAADEEKIEAVEAVVLVTQFAVEQMVALRKLVVVGNIYVCLLKKFCYYLHNSIGIYECYHMSEEWRCKSP